MLLQIWLPKGVWSYQLHRKILEGYGTALSFFLSFFFLGGGGGWGGGGAVLFFVVVH